MILGDLSGLGMVKQQVRFQEMYGYIHRYIHKLIKIQTKIELKGKHKGMLTKTGCFTAGDRIKELQGQVTQGSPRSREQGTSNKVSRASIVLLTPI